MSNSRPGLLSTKRPPEMSKRGPKTKPKTTGEPGPLPEPPYWLEGETALRLWHMLAAPLNRLGLLESLDIVAFSLLCDSFETYIAARDQLTPDKFVEYVGESRHPTQNPLVSIVRQQTKGLKELLSEFGLTPQSRTALTGSTAAKRETAEVDPLEALAAEFAAGPVPTVTPPARKAKPTRRKKTAKKKSKKKTTPRKKTAKKKATTRKPNTRKQKT